VEGNIDESQRNSLKACCEGNKLGLGLSFYISMQKLEGENM